MSLRRLVCGDIFWVRLYFHDIKQIKKSIGDTFLPGGIDGGLASSHLWRQLLIAELR